MSGGFPVAEYNNREAFFGYILPCTQLKEGRVLPDCHMPCRSYGILSQRNTMFVEWKEEDGSGETEIGKQKEVRVTLPAEPMTKHNF